MNYLIICHDAGAEISAPASWFAENAQNRVMLATDRGPEDYNYPNISRIILKKPDFKLARVSLPEYMANFMRRAEKAAFSLKMLAESANAPDIILASAANGIAFGLRELFPRAFIVNYLEDCNAFSHVETRARGLLQVMQAICADACFAFAERPRKLLPEGLASQVKMAPLAIDSDFFSPEEAGAREGRVVIFLDGVALEEYAKWLQMAQKLPGATFMTPNMISAKYMAKLLENLPEGEREKIRTLKWPTRQERKKLLCGALLVLSAAREIDFHILEAMSCGTAVMTRAKGPFWEPGKNCLAFQARGLGECVIRLLGQPEKLRQTGEQAREDVMRHYDYRKLMPAHERLILELREKAIKSQKGKGRVKG